MEGSDIYAPQPETPKIRQRQRYNGNNQRGGHGERDKVAGDQRGNIGGTALGCDNRYSMPGQGMWRMRRQLPVWKASRRFDA